MTELEYASLLKFAAQIGTIMVAVVVAIFAGLKAKEKLDASKEPPKVPQVTVEVEALRTLVIAHHDQHIERERLLEADVVKRSHDLRNEMNQARLTDAVTLARFEGRLDNTANEVKRLELMVQAGFIDVNKRLDNTNEKLDQILLGQGRRASDHTG